MWFWERWELERQAEREAFLEALCGVTSIAQTLAETFKAQADLQLAAITDVGMPERRILTEEDEAKLEQEHFARQQESGKMMPFDPFQGMIVRPMTFDD